MIYKCDCVNKHQDELYGKGRRVHNLCKPNSGQRVIRCTVCKREKDIEKYIR